MPKKKQKPAVAPTYKIQCATLSHVLDVLRARKTFTVGGEVRTDAAVIAAIERVERELGPVGGFFTMTAFGNTTDQIPYNANHPQIMAALRRTSVTPRRSR